MTDDAHGPAARTCASSTGRKISVFFAHWCSLMACSHAFHLAGESRKVRTGTIPAERIPARRPESGFATMGSTQWVSKGTSRSEEHTSELQSRQYLVCRLL